MQKHCDSSWHCSQMRIFKVAVYIQERQRRWEKQKEQNKSKSSNSACCKTIVDSERNRKQLQKSMKSEMAFRHVEIRIYCIMDIQSETNKRANQTLGLIMVEILQCVCDCHCTMGGQPSIEGVNSSHCIGKNIMALIKRGT